MPTAAFQRYKNLDSSLYTLRAATVEYVAYRTGSGSLSFMLAQDTSNLGRNSFVLKRQHEGKAADKLGDGHGKYA